MPPTTSFDPPTLDPELARRQPHGMTADEFEAWPGNGGFELVRGVVTEKPMSGFESSLAAMEFGSRLRHYSQKHGGSVVPPECDLRCFGTTKDVRRPDGGFLVAGRESELSGSLREAPDLIVESLSPNDRVQAVEEKMKEYFAAGVKLVVLIQTGLRCVVVHDADGFVAGFREDEEFTCDLLPGFSVRVSELMPARKDTTTDG